MKHSDFKRSDARSFLFGLIWFQREEKTFTEARVVNGWSRRLPAIESNRDSIVFSLPSERGLDVLVHTQADHTQEVTQQIHVGDLDNLEGAKYRNQGLPIRSVSCFTVTVELQRRHRCECRHVALYQMTSLTTQA